MDEHDRAGPGPLPDREPGVRSERHEMKAAHRLHQGVARDEAGEAEEERRRLAVGDDEPLGPENLVLGVDALRQKEVRRIGELPPIRVGIGMVHPDDVERAGVALVETSQRKSFS